MCARFTQPERKLSTKNIRAPCYSTHFWRVNEPMGIKFEMCDSPPPSPFSANSSCLPLCSPPIHRVCPEFETSHFSTAANGVFRAETFCLHKIPSPILAERCEVVSLLPLRNRLSTFPHLDWTHSNNIVIKSLLFFEGALFTHTFGRVL